MLKVYFVLYQANGSSNLPDGVGKSVGAGGCPNGGHGGWGPNDGGLGRGNK